MQHRKTTKPGAEVQQRRRQAMQHMLTLCLDTPELRATWPSLDGRYIVQYLDGEIHREEVRLPVPSTASRAPLPTIEQAAIEFLGRYIEQHRLPVERITIRYELKLTDRRRFTGPQRHQMRNAGPHPDPWLIVSLAWDALPHSSQIFLFRIAKQVEFTDAAEALVARGLTERGDET